MKIQPAHYAHMLNEIKAIAPKFAAHRELLIQEGKAKDIEKRLRWDALYAAMSSRWVCENLYPYMDDTHIDTALRAIMKEIGAR